ncbi:MAG: hypothetical protein PF961_15615, partial [Planctomycetota bacterium]|jgi:hypothetical protein|nr:hypothetical protein [Planctomycetota bacterium]
VPAARLHVSGDGVFSRDIYVDKTYLANSGGGDASHRLDGYEDKLFVVAEPGVTSGAGIVLRTGEAGGVALDRLTVTPDGQFGFGIQSPLARLHVNGGGIFTSNVELDKLILANSTGGDAVHRVDGYADTLYVVASPGQTSDGSIVLRTGVAGGLEHDRVTVAPNGRVGLGIGSAGALAQLTVAVEGTTAGVPDIEANGILVTSNAGCGVNIHTPNDKRGQILFGDPQNRKAGSVIYDHASGVMQVESESGVNVVGGPLRTDGHLVVYGSDIRLGVADGRNVGQNPYGRALVHVDNQTAFPGAEPDTLMVNHAGDFEGGVVVGSDARISGDLGVDGKLAADQLTMPDGQIWVSDATGTAGQSDYRIDASEDANGARFNLQAMDEAGAWVRDLLSLYHDGRVDARGFASRVWEGHTELVLKNDAAVVARIVNWNDSALHVDQLQGKEVMLNCYGTGGVVVGGEAPWGTPSNLVVYGRIVGTQFGWSDHVFDDDYDLPTIAELRAFIDERGHLPGVPSEAEVLESGVDMGGMLNAHMEKIEELVLYAMEAEAERDLAVERVGALEERIERLERLVLKLATE